MGMMRITRGITTMTFQRTAQRGFVLIIVLLLIIMISGLGLLAVRHSRQEARSTGAYVDSTHAIALVESGMAMAITDLRASPDWYRQEFTVPENMIPGAIDMWELEYDIDFSADLFGVGPAVCKDSTPPAGCKGDLSKDDTASALAIGDFASYQTLITYDSPLVGPCPPGYSCFDDQNYGWYVFGINVVARFGTAPNFWDKNFVETARAEGSGRVTIGPIGAYGY